MMLHTLPKVRSVLTSIRFLLLFASILLGFSCCLLLSADFFIMTTPNGNLPPSLQLQITPPLVTYENQEEVDYDPKNPCSKVYQSSPTAKRLCQRRQNIEEACSTYFPRQYGWFDGFLGKKSVNRHFPPNFLVSDKAKILYCSIPKVASTTWKNYFNHLVNFLSSSPGQAAEQSGSQQSSNSSSTTSLRRLSEYSPQEVHEILEKYTKIVWIRDPLQRLVSAWRDKLSRNNSYYSRAIGSKIISRYRTNASTEDIETGFPSSLEEFFRYLEEEPVRNYDVHWKSQAQTCLLCKIHWDFYGAFENMQEESDFVIQKSLETASTLMTADENGNKNGDKAGGQLMLKLPPPSSPPNPNNDTTTISYSNSYFNRQIRDEQGLIKPVQLPKLPVLNRVQYTASENLRTVLEQIPAELLQRVLQRGYKKDFKILGYSMPPVISDTNSKINNNYSSNFSSSEQQNLLSIITA